MVLGLVVLLVLQLVLLLGLRLALGLLVLGLMWWMRIRGGLGLVLDLQEQDVLLRGQLLVALGGPVLGEPAPAGARVLKLRS